MIGTIKNIIGVEEEASPRIKEYMDLTQEFEKTISSDFPNKKTASRTIETAKRIRNLVGERDLILEREQKLKLLKMLNKAKVRALMVNQDYAFDIFSNLDSISTEVARKI